METAILLDRHGRVTEGPGYNGFTVINGTMVTPQFGALEGIARKTVIELCDILGLPCEVRNITRAEIEDTDEILDDSRRYHADQQARHPHPWKRPTGTDRNSVEGGFLGKAQAGLARNTDRVGIDLRPNAGIALLIPVTQSWLRQAHEPGSPRRFSPIEAGDQC